MLLIARILQLVVSACPAYEARNALCLGASAAAPEAERGGRNQDRNKCARHTLHGVLLVVLLSG